MGDEADTDPDNHTEGPREQVLGARHSLKQNAINKWKLSRQPPSVIGTIGTARGTQSARSAISQWEPPWKKKTS
jgi:hypothetical protein